MLEKVWLQRNRCLHNVAMLPSVPEPEGCNADGGTCYSMQGNHQSAGGMFANPLLQADHDSKQPQQVQADLLATLLLQIVQ